MKSKQDIEISNLKTEIKQLKKINAEYVKDLVKTYLVLENNKKGRGKSMTYGFTDLRYEYMKKQNEYKKYCEAHNREFIEKPYTGKPYVWSLLVFETGAGRKLITKQNKESNGVGKLNNYNKAYIYLLKIFTDSNEEIPIGSRIKVYKPVLKRHMHSIMKRGVKFSINEAYLKSESENVLEIIKPQIK